MKREIIYDDDKLAVETTGRSYDFIATVENKTDETIIIMFTGEYSYCDDFKIDAEEWVGILADDEGRDTLKAFETGDFMITSEDY